MKRTRLIQVPEVWYREGPSRNLMYHNLVKSECREVVCDVGKGSETSAYRCTFSDLIDRRHTPHGGGAK